MLKANSPYESLLTDGLDSQTCFITALGGLNVDLLVTFLNGWNSFSETYMFACCTNTLIGLLVCFDKKYS